MNICVHSCKLNFSSVMYWWYSAWQVSGTITRQASHKCRNFSVTSWSIMEGRTSFLKRRARIVRKAFYAWTLQHSWLVTQHLRIQDKMRSNEAVCTGLLYQYQSWKQSSCLELVLCILCRRFHFLFLSLLCALFHIVNISKYFGGLGKRFAAQIFRWNLPKCITMIQNIPFIFCFLHSLFCELVKDTNWVWTQTKDVALSCTA